MGLIARYKRWRHGHGFGVHSPYAYHMVREVLRHRRGYAYYAYSSLPQGELRLLYRILVELRPAIVTVCAEGVRRRALEQLVALALPSASIGTEGEMLIADGINPAPPIQPRYAYFNNTAHPAIGPLADSITRGHIYRNPSRVLLIRHEKLPKQTFEVKF